MPASGSSQAEELFRQRTGDKNQFDPSIQQSLNVMGSTVDKALINNTVLRGELVPRASDWVAERLKQHLDRLELMRVLREALQRR